MVKSAVFNDGWVSHLMSCRVGKPSNVVYDGAVGVPPNVVYERRVGKLQCA